MIDQSTIEELDMGIQLSLMIISGAATLIGKYFQDRTAMINKDVASRKAFAEKSKEIFDVVLANLNSLCYQNEQAVLTYLMKPDDKESIVGWTKNKEDAWKAYVVDLAAWQKNKNYYPSMVAELYGKDMGAKLVHIRGKVDTIIKQLNAVHYDRKQSPDYLVNDEGASKSANDFRKKYYDVKNEIDQLVDTLGIEMAEITSRNT